MDENALIFLGTKSAFGKYVTIGGKKVDFEKFKRGKRREYKRNHKQLLKSRRKQRLHNLQRGK